MTLLNCLLLMIRKVHILRCIQQMVETYQKQSSDSLLAKRIFLMPQTGMFLNKSGIHFANAAVAFTPFGPTFAVMTRVFAYFSEASTMSTYSV